jgi:hypothetical protein
LQAWHNTASLRRTGSPHDTHAREHTTHAPVPGWRMLSLPHFGQAAFAAAAVTLRQQLQQ